MNQSKIILSAETQFAREVTLGVIYQMPLPVWYSLIPGMFLFDFIRRNRAISNFTKYYMFPRKLALDTAASILNGEKPSVVDKRTQTGIEDGFKSQGLLSKDLVNAQKKVIDLLAGHYKKLLKAEGAHLDDVIENAYKTRKAFQSHINQLGKAENKINQILLNHVGLNEKFKERLKIEARQVQLRRDKMIDHIF